MYSVYTRRENRPLKAVPDSAHNANAINSGAFNQILEEGCEPVFIQIINVTFKGAGASDKLKWFHSENPHR